MRRPVFSPVPRPTRIGRLVRWTVAGLAVLGYGTALLLMAHHAGPDQPVAPVVQLDR